MVSKGNREPQTPSGRHPSLRERIGRWFFPGVAALEASLEAKLREAAGVKIDDDEDQWRKLSGSAERDLSPMTQSRMQRNAAHLWEANLLAERMIELPIAYLLAEGVKVTSEDEAVQEAIDAFWGDPINRLDLNLPDLVRELFLYGEQCWPAFVNEANGQVRLGYLDPCLISEVVMDPDNPRLPVGVVTMRDRKGRYRKYRVIYNGSEEELFTARTRTLREGFSDGEAFLYSIKRLLSGTRGRSLLLGQMDWVDGYDQYLFGELDRALAMRTFVWDVTLRNATAEQVKARAKEISAPRPNSVNVHNDSETWQPQAPSLQGNDNAEFARLLRNHVLGGGTIPEHWYGGGGDVNRSTGESMQEPTLKTFAMYQRLIGSMLVETCKYAVRRRLGKEVSFTGAQAIIVEWPELMAQDVSRHAAAIGQVVAAATIAIERGLITELMAVSLIAVITRRLGVEIDANAELAAAQAERAKRREEESFVSDPASLPD